MNETIIIGIFLIILLSLIWVLRFLSYDRFIFYKIMRLKLNSISWKKFIFIYILIQGGICGNDKLILFDKLSIPILIMFCLFSMFMCSSSFEDIKEIKTDPDFEIQKKIWERNRKIDKIL